MADVRCQHLKTGEIKTLPEKVFKAVQAKWRFLSYVDDPNVQPPLKPSGGAPVVTADPFTGIENTTTGDIGETKTMVVSSDDLETIEELRVKYELQTGKKAGNKKRETLEKELNQ